MIDTIHLRLLLATFAAWANRQQTSVITYLIEENRVLKEHPWVALELFKAFQRSKEVAYERARRSQLAYLFFPGKDFQEQAAVFGDDPYPIGLRAMGNNVERAIRGSLEQGLLRRPLRLEDIYYRTTLNT